MGQDKALIKYRGRTLLETTENLLTQLGINDITILGHPAAKNGIKDPKPHAGPAANLISWISEQPKPFYLVVLPVDMPLMTPEQIKYLMSYREGAYFTDLYLPFTCPVGESIVSEVHRMKDLLKELKITCVQPKENWGKKLVNINEPTDLSLLSPRN